MLIGLKAVYWAIVFGQVVALSCQRPSKDAHKLISFGACGRVYTGRITSDPEERVVAVNKSLWASTIKSPMLRHEACTLVALKAPNFLFDLNSASGLIKLIDFGLAKVYFDSSTHEHVQPTKTKYVIGTRAFVSLNMHLHRGPSRRDDMESLAYTIAALLCDGLPWYQANRSECFAVKQTWSGAALCSGYDPVFGEFIDYTRSLVFQETPDYAGWRRRFLTIAPELCGRPLYNPADRGVKLREGPILQGMYCPYSTWGNPEHVADEDVIGDEARMVRESLGCIEELPKADREREVMHVDDND
ncbi:kinase-like domain-containing protein [Schizophyllum amplum]|uniref:Kinase-like domain-containing protein n=1 Tax=Schizophyllum amplum TaxID=97359 RepID=A0A550C886_9AGAR|nr:kinase-like domain-containing protein [Auriculariopsis ampla]